MTALRRAHPGPSWAERSLRLEAVLLVAAIRVGLWLLPLRALRRWLALLGRAPRAPWEAGSPDRVARAVARAGRSVPRATCLAQALAGQVLLERRGHPARLRIGFRWSDDRRLEGHAWVESAGRIVTGGAELARHAALSVLEVEGGRR